MRFVFFTPGDYKLTAQLHKYWLGNAVGSRSYYTAQKSTIVHIAAPQSFAITLTAADGRYRPPRSWH